jgi:hypothetical protein
MARRPTLMPDFPGSSAAQESLVPVKVAQAEARPTSPSGPHAASQRTRHWADSEPRKVEWQMMADQDD